MSQSAPDTKRPRIPAATYRLQLNRNFTFRQASEIIPYLRDLGISDLYSSPCFEAAPDSTHGYDISNHNNLNPSIGTREDYKEMAARLREHDMGQVADFVPNHMGVVSPNNTWWMDVLENGPSSRHARFFDIDWRPNKEELRDKVLLPVLGDQYGRVLERGEFRLSLRQGAFFLHYYDFTLPIAPCSYGRILRPALEELTPYYNEELLDELQSILHAVEHLPAIANTDDESVLNRAREKEVIKRRLDRLCSDCPQMLEGIEQSLRAFHGEPGNPETFDKLHDLLNAQAYRLSFWRVAAEEINYRRFFDINDLAAIRVELPEVFEAVHGLLLDLVKEGAVTGVRLDHPDGLWDPQEYIGQLQQQAAEAMRIGDSSRKPLYLLAEKILSGDEELPDDWQLHGTTGYDFMNDAIGVMVEGDNESAFTSIYANFIDHRFRFQDLVYECKRLVMRLSLANDINVLGQMLNRLSERNRWYRDFTLNSLTTAVREVIACFPVYRTYLAPNRPISMEDQQAILLAVARAKRRNPAIESSIFNFLRDNLLFQFPENISEEEAGEHRAFVMKFQQCTGPVMAKGLEDTAFYIYNRLIALNEVGGEPQRFGLSVQDFHAHNLRRLQSWPHSMNSSSTHDTKRSEDTRARIASISEIPDLWRTSLADWRKANAGLKTEIDGEEAPSPNEEYLFYQILIGTWPFEEQGADEWSAYVERVQNFMTKAAKEAKVNTSWIQPNDEWDEAVTQFVRQTLDREKNGEFIHSFSAVAEKTSAMGAVNSLSQLVLKLTVPGVPDIYQGNELWDFSMVDPDNRRPVDFNLRRERLGQVKEADPADLLSSWQDGRIKMFLTRSILCFRNENPLLFQEGKYVPLELSGRHRERGIAFKRWHGEEVMVVFIPRLTGGLDGGWTGDVWGDTAIETGGLIEQPALANHFTGEPVPIEEDRIHLKTALAKLPFLLLK